MYNGVELYEQDRNVAVLISESFGAPWSSGVDQRLAYDKRIVEFWMEHKDDTEFMRAMDAYHSNPIQKYAEKLFSEWGYEDIYFGGFSDIELVWVPKGKSFQIREYDGSEWIQMYNPKDWTMFP